MKRYRDASDWDADAQAIRENCGREIPEGESLVIVARGYELGRELCPCGSGRTVQAWDVTGPYCRVNAQGSPVGHYPRRG